MGLFRAEPPAVNSPAPSIVPPPLTDHVGVNGTVLPAASFATAENCSVPAVAMVWLSGLTTIVAIVGTGAPVTVTVAVPLMLPLVALTVDVPGAAPAVKSPELVMVPLPLVTDHVGVMATMFPWASFPTATNCCVPATATLTRSGATSIVANAPDGVIAALTTIVADPDTPPLVAWMVAVSGEAGAVNIPAGVMVPSPLATDHVGVIATGFPAESRPIAANCRVPEVGRVSVAGATVMLVSVPLLPDTPVGGAFSLVQWMENIAAALAPATTRPTALCSEGDMVKTLAGSCSARPRPRKTWS